MSLMVSLARYGFPKTRSEEVNMLNSEPEINQSDIKPWNVMIYMSANNNLSEECVFALKEIDRLRLSDKINVVAQLDTNIRGVPLKRFHFKGRPESNGPTSPSIAEQNYQFVATGGVKTSTRPNKETDGRLFKREDHKFLPSSHRPSAIRNNGRQNISNSADPKVLEAFIKSGI